MRENAFIDFRRVLVKPFRKRSPQFLRSAMVDASKSACALFGFLTVAAGESAVTAVSGASAVSLSELEWDLRWARASAWRLVSALQSA